MPAPMDQQFVDAWNQQLREEGSDRVAVIGDQAVTDITGSARHYQSVTPKQLVKIVDRRMDLHRQEWHRMEVRKAGRRVVWHHVLYALHIMAWLASAASAVSGNWWAIPGGFLWAYWTMGARDALKAAKAELERTQNQLPIAEAHLLR